MERLKRFFHKVSTLLLKDRTATALILALLLSVGMGLLRLDKPKGMSPKTFWAIKLSWKHCADAVLTGDSRVLMAASPEILATYVNHGRVVNYAFGANSYSPEYLQAIGELLDPGARNKAIIMGLSPNTLTERKKGLEGLFIELSAETENERFFNRYMGPLYDFYDPMSMKDVLQGLFPSKAPTRTTKVYKPDGWCAVHKVPGDENHEVKNYREIYKQRQVSEKTVDDVLDYVSRWSSKGIKVYGFLPPTCREMVELEETASGLKKEEFIKRFKQAGGIWLDVNLTDYYSFDGSHLQDDSAVEFSNDLGKMIQEAENGSNSVVRTN